MKLVCLCPYVPHPRINHAGGRFVLDYLPRMAKLCSVTLVAPGTPDNLVARAYAPEDVSVHLFPPRTEWGRLARGLTQHPFETVFGFTQGVLMRRPFAKDEATMAVLRDADVIEVQFSQYLPLLTVAQEVAPDAARTAHEHDVFADHLQEALSAASTTRGRLRARGRLAWLPGEERRLLNSCNLVITHNYKDRDGLRALGVQSPIEVIYPPITVPGVAVDPARNCQVSFMGAMWRRENQEAVRWFADHVWPRVRAEVPGARFVVAGDGPVQWLRSLPASEGIEVTGFLPALDPVYEATGVAVVPTLGSSGIKVKALQAMAFGLPVVATRAGAAGLIEQTGESTFAGVADDPGAFADAVVGCLTEPEAARAVGARARAWVLDNCDFDAAVQRIAARYRALVEARGRAA